jgi:lipopolysaccharide exporter
MACNLGTALTGTLMAWLVLANGWRPQLRLKFSEIRQFIRFGLYMIGNNLANTFNSQIDIFLGSKLLGATSVGLYNVPKELTLRVAGLINPIMTQVAFPVMAKAQDDEAQLRRIYLQIMRMTASVNFPVYIFMGIFSQDIVTTLLGENWGRAAPLLQILSIWALVRSTANPAGSLLMACGRADLSLKWNLGMLAVVSPCIWTGSHFGINGMGVAMAGVMLLGFWPNWRYLIKPLCHAGFGEYIKQISTPLAISITAGILGSTVQIMESTGLLRIIVELCVTFIAYIILTYNFNRVCFDIIKELFSSKK